MMRIENQDYDGPTWDNKFVPSIEVVDEQDNAYCIGLRYTGASTIDSKNYIYDHTNLFNSSNPEGLPVTEERITELLSSSEITLQQLKETFVLRIGHSPNKE